MKHGYATNNRITWTKKYFIKISVTEVVTKKKLVKSRLPKSQPQTN